MLRAVEERALATQGVDRGELAADILGITRTSLIQMRSNSKISFETLRKLSLAAKLNEEEEAALMISWLLFKSKTDNRMRGPKVIIERIAKELEKDGGELRIDATPTLRALRDQVK